MAHGIIKRERETNGRHTYILFFNSKLQDKRQVFLFNYQDLSTGLKPALSLVWGFILH